MLMIYNVYANIYHDIENVLCARMVAFPFFLFELSCLNEFQRGTLCTLSDILVFGKIINHVTMVSCVKMFALVFFSLLELSPLTNSKGKSFDAVFN